MNKRLFHALGFAVAATGFLFFRLWPSHPPLSVTQDEYLQRTAAAQPPAPRPIAHVTPPAPVPDPRAAAVRVAPPAPATVTTPPALLAAMPAPLPAALPVAPSPNAEPGRTAVPAKPRALVRKQTAAPQPQGVNARFPRHDVQPGQKTGGVNDIYGPQSQALDDFAKKSGRGVDR